MDFYSIHDFYISNRITSDLFRKVLLEYNLTTENTRQFKILYISNYYPSISKYKKVHGNIIIFDKIYCNRKSIYVGKIISKQLKTEEY